MNTCFSCKHLYLRDSSSCPGCVECICKLNGKTVNAEESCDRYEERTNDEKD